MKNLCSEDKLEIIRQFARERGLSPAEISKGSGISVQTVEALLSSEKAVKHQCRVVDSVIDFIERKMSIQQNASCDDVIKSLRERLELNTKLVDIYRKQASFCSGCSKLSEP